MSESLDQLEYRNEDDKAYGLAGMIIALSSMDSLELVQSVSLDADDSADETMIEFTDEYYHVLAPNVSPKSVWETLQRNFYITSSMVLGNVMARSVVRDGTQVNEKLLKIILNMMRIEAEETLDMGNDETDLLYRQMLRRNMNLFYNPQVRSKVKALSRRLALLRNLTVRDIVSELEGI